MALPNARNQYLKTQIETASKEQLVVMLFDGIIRFTELARSAMHEQKIEESHNALMRAQAIIMELICTVDKEKGGEVANSMLSLHAYAFNCLIVCNMKKDVTKIDEVQKIYRELREAWTGAMDSLGISSQSGKPAEAAPAAAANPQPAPATVVPTPTPTTPAVKPAGIMAKASTPADKQTTPTTLVTGSTQIVIPDAPVAAPATTPAPAAPKATGYGMGRTAMLGALAAQTPPAKPAAPAAPAAPAGQTVTTPQNAKQNALLNAYGAGTRSIA